MFVTEKSPGEVPFSRENDLSSHTHLKLSEAMRVGAKLRGQCRQQLFYGGSSCALGAAYEAVYGHPAIEEGGFPSKDPRFDRPLGNGLNEAFPQLEKHNSDGERLLSAIWRLNDDKGWTREQIADWLEAQGL